MYSPKVKIVSAYLFSLFILSCQSFQGVGSSGDSNSATRYSEDLSMHRPVVPEVVETETPVEEGETDAVETEVNRNQFDSLWVNSDINNLIDSIAVLKIAENKIKGYTILVHTGNNRMTALEIKGQLMVAFPDLESRLVFQEPNFRLKAGQFSEVIQAEKLLSEIKTIFPAAMLIRETFELKKEGDE